MFQVCDLTLADESSQVYASPFPTLHIVLLCTRNDDIS